MVGYILAGFNPQQHRAGWAFDNCPPGHPRLAKGVKTIACFPSDWGAIGEMDFAPAVNVRPYTWVTDQKKIQIQSWPAVC